MLSVRNPLPRAFISTITFPASTAILFSPLSHSHSCQSSLSLSRDLQSPPGSGRTVADVHRLQIFKPKMCGKVATKFIKDPKSRNATFNKREQGLKKKAYELSTLCGIDTCMIWFKKDDGDGPSKPLTWPHEASEVERIIKRYKSVSDVKEKRKVDLSTFLENKKKKMEDELVRIRQVNEKMTMNPCWEDRIDDWPEDSLPELANQLDAKMEDVRKRIALLKDNQRFQQLNEEVEVSKLDIQLQPLPDYSTPEFLHDPCVFNSDFMPNTSSGGEFDCSTDGLPSLPFTNLDVEMLINPGFGMPQNNNEGVAYNAFHQEGCFYGSQHFSPSDFWPSNQLPYQTPLMHP